MARIINADKPGLFRVEIDGYDSQNFQYAGPFEWEMGEAAFRDGPDLRDTKEPNGVVTFPDVTIRRTLSSNSDLWDWAKNTIDTVTGTGQNPEDLKVTVDVVQMDRTHADVKRFRLYGAWIKRYSAGENDTGADAAKNEEVVLSVDHWEKIDNA